MDDGKIERELLRQNCDWISSKFNPPKASHMGGTWERLIRSARAVLEALLMKHSGQMDDELFRTLLAEIKMVVNS